jgi:tRNA threonylcarbamoyladenosine biosynthesis protein TsaB
MKILVIDTCGATGSVALADTERDPATVISATLPGRSASERLVATIKDLTARPGLALKSLDAIAVVHGPGSFTGVRVGLSAAKGLCEALSLPLIAISRLAVLAHLADPAGGRVAVLIDAGRGEFYFGEYASGTCIRESLVTRDQLLAVIQSNAATGQPAVVTCEASVAASLAELAPRLIAEPTAEDALPLILRRLRDQDFDDIATIDANYLRRTDAEIFAKPTAASLRPGTPGR